MFSGGSVDDLAIQYVATGKRLCRVRTLLLIHRHIHGDGWPPPLTQN